MTISHTPAFGPLTGDLTISGCKETFIGSVDGLDLYLREKDSGRKMLWYRNRNGGWNKLAFDMRFRIPASQEGMTPDFTAFFKSYDNLMS